MIYIYKGNTPGKSPSASRAFSPARHATRSRHLSAPPFLGVGRRARHACRRSKNGRFSAQTAPRRGHGSPPPAGGRACMIRPCVPPRSLSPNAPMSSRSIALFFNRANGPTRVDRVRICTCRSVARPCRRSLCFRLVFSISRGGRIICFLCGSNHGW